MDRCLAIEFAGFDRHLFIVIIDRLISMAVSALVVVVLFLGVFIHLMLPFIAATIEAASEVFSRVMFVVFG